MSQEWIERYARGPERLRQAVEGLDEDRLAFKPSPQAWSIKQIIIHLADTEVVVVHRLKSVISEDKPLIPPFDQDDWANRLDYMSQDHQLHLSLFKLLRESMVPVLNQLSEADWSRTGVRNTGSEITLLELLKTYTEHVDTHLGQIERAKAAYAASRA